MYISKILIKIILFIIGFSLIYYLVRLTNLLPHGILTANNSTIPWMFDVIATIFSIISAFVIQTKWHSWDDLLDATHEELSSFKQLITLTNYFPEDIRKGILQAICNYLKTIIDESQHIELSIRTESVENELYSLEKIILDINVKEHPNIGALSFELVRKIIESREKRLQNAQHKLPLGVKAFQVYGTFSVIISSFFIGANTLIYDYFFTLIIAVLVYCIYLLIDDLDNPYRPGGWHIKTNGYQKLYERTLAMIINHDK
jgi:hypothetical protein